jgi:hypothetical protein
LKYILTALAGAAAGCLFMLLLNQPWLRPFETNTAAVVAALSSTVLAVIGAFGLWIYQTRMKQAQLERIYIPIFQPLYENIVFVRQLATSGGTEATMDQMADKLPIDQPARKLLPHELAQFQRKALPDAVKISIVMAKNAVTHWASVQDVLVNLPPDRLAGLIELHQIATVAIEKLPEMYAKGKPQSLDQMFWEFEAEDLGLIDYGLSSMAKTLNAIDGGSRDESGTALLEPAVRQIRAALGQAAR